MGDLERLGGHPKISEQHQPLWQTARPLPGSNSRTARPLAQTQIHWQTNVPLFFGWPSQRLGIPVIRIFRFVCLLMAFALWHTFPGSCHHHCLLRVVHGQHPIPFGFGGVLPGSAPEIARLPFGSWVPLSMSSASLGSVRFRVFFLPSWPWQCSWSSLLRLDRFQHTKLQRELLKLATPLWKHPSSHERNPTTHQPAPSSSSLPTWQPAPAKASCTQPKTFCLLSQPTALQSCPVPLGFSWSFLLVWPLPQRQEPNEQSSIEMPRAGRLTSSEFLESKACRRWFLPKALSGSIVGA